MTTQTLQLIGVLLSEPDAEWYGLQLAGEAGLKSGSVYVVLARLEQAGWLTSRWEQIDPSAEGRPRRRLYALTGDGRQAGAQAIEEHLAALTGLSRPRSASGQRPGLAAT